ncbi:hypothetical protein ACS0TY_016328 [Phlomoides rotata]
MEQLEAELEAEFGRLQLQMNDGGFILNYSQQPYPEGMTTSRVPLMAIVMPLILCIWEKLEIYDVTATMSNRSSNTVCTSVTSTNHHDFLAPGRDVFVILKIAIEQAFCICMEKFHCKMDSRKKMGKFRNLKWLFLLIKLRLGQSHLKSQEHPGLHHGPPEEGSPSLHQLGAECSSESSRNDNQTLHHLAPKRLTVDLSGGPLDIEWRENDYHIYMTGPAELVFYGSVPVDNGDSEEPKITPEQAVRLCDRNFGIGADGVIFALPGINGTDYTMQIFNSDGSEPGKFFEVYSFLIWCCSFTVHIGAGLIVSEIQEDRKNLFKSSPRITLKCVCGSGAGAMQH